MTRFARHLPLLALLAAFLTWEFACPRFFDNDETFFKCAGLQLFQGRGFNAPELAGFLGLQPPLTSVYAAQPPLCPWLFGQWLHLTGFGWAACVGYDAVISAALAAVVYALAVRLPAASGLTGARRRALGLMAAAVTLLLRQPARPDELGMLLAYASVWLLLPAPGRETVAPGTARTAAAGAFAGLVLGTSTGVFLAFAPFWAALWAWRSWWGPSPRRAAVQALAGTAGALLATGACLLPLFLIRHDFLQQFLGHARVQVGGPARLPAALALAWEVARPRIFVTLATIPVLLWALARLWRAGRQVEALALLAAPMVGFILVVVTRGAHTYWWFLQPWFLLTAGAVLAASRVLGRMVAGTWLALGLAAALIWPAREILLRAMLPGEQRVGPSVAGLRAAVPPGACVVTAAGWWALGADRHVLDPQFSDAADLGAIDYVVADGNGSRTPGVWMPPANPRYAEALRAGSFAPLADGLPRTPTRLLRVPLSRSAYGFGTVVLRRGASPVDGSAPAP